MEGKAAVITKLQDALHSELTGVHQYVLHAAMFENWGYEALASTTKARSYVEMKHADALIDRILFLNGKPELTKPIELKIGANVKKMLENDLSIELQAVKDYNEAIKTAVAEGDGGSRSLLEEHLKAEEDHVNYIESQLAQIGGMGIENYLAEQIAEE